MQKRQRHCARSPDFRIPTALGLLIDSPDRNLEIGDEH
jgi:hypothetical protein